MHEKDIQQYCKDIISGKILSGTYTKKAVKRFLEDIKRQKDEDFLYVYKPEYAYEVIDFAESLIIPDIQTEDKRLRLLPWMKFIYANIFGWRYKHDENKRRFRSGYVEVARKSGKTTGILFPFILWDFLDTDAAESYFVSKDGGQSSTIFKELLYIIKENKELREVISETTSAITYQNSRIAFFSSESAGIDSYKNSMSVIDEFHAYDNNRVITAFRYGGRARINNLVMIITSAGNDVSRPCYDENQKCKKILNKTIVDETYFGIIYSYDEDDDWKDSKKLIKSNPSLGTFLTEDVLLNDLQDALNTPSHQNDYKSKTCGIWTSGTSSWIPIHKWQRNNNIKINEEDLLGHDTVAAIDLSSVRDFSAYTLYFKTEDNLYYAKHKFYIPESQVIEKSKSDNINIIGWIQNGYVIATPGETVDYDFIFEDILKDSKKYNIKEIAYDKWHSNKLIDRLDSELYNITTVKYDQSLKAMSPATKKYEQAIYNGKIIDNNPVMLWMIGNVVIKPDVNGNYKPLKEYSSSSKRIDGVITSIMAFDRFVENENVKREYTLEEMLASI